MARRTAASLVALVTLLTLGGVPPAEAAEAPTDTWILVQRGAARSLVAELEALGAEATPLPQIGVVVARSDDPEFGAVAARLGGVQDLAPDALFHVETGLDALPVDVSAVDGAQPREPSHLLDGDPLHPLQWGHLALDVPAAWQRLADQGVGRGAGVRVAIVDTGIDADHPDLAPNLDAALSRSFIAGESWRARDGYIFHHGTSVAGIVAAADNGLGIVGIAPEAELVAIKVVSERTNSGSAAALLQGIVYAADIGADIINLSLDAGLSLRDGDAALWTAFVRAALYAHHRGATLIAAAGNDALDLDRDRDARLVPQQLPHVLTVTSTAPAGWALDPSTDLDLFSSYNNYGSTVVDFAGPGGGHHDLGDDAFAQCTVVLTSWCISFDFVFTTIGDGWLWANGTSFAAPHVAGVAALVIGQAGGDLHPARVAAALRRGADDLGTPGHDPRFGHGRVNALGALD